MFDALTEKLNGVFRQLSGRGVLTEKTVDAALRDIRLALIEADVGLDVVKRLIADIRKRATGQETLRSVAPGQQILHIVHDEVTGLLGGGQADTGLRVDSPPAAVLVVGLQGAGKTTTVGKLARLIERERKASVLVASLDVRRPAAMEQLRQLAERGGYACLPAIEGQPPVAIGKRAMQAARLAGHDAVLLDTAGRTTIDEESMDEAAAIARAVSPTELLLVADALSGQDAVQTARRFKERLDLTGLIMTRIDGDSRGGAVLSMRAETGVPVKFVGTGEGPDDLEGFDPAGIAGRILGRGDLAGLAEKVARAADTQASEAVAARLKKGKFGLGEFAEQLRTIGRMGGLGGIAAMIPGAAGLAGAPDPAEASRMRASLAAIGSMTPAERDRPEMLNASRKRRIARGAGVEVAQINRMLKLHRGMADMMRKMGGKGMAGLGRMPGGGFPPGAAGADPAALMRAIRGGR